MPALQLAFIGRHGVGLSTVAANLSAALAEAGHRVMQIGCGATGDSTALLRRFPAPPTAAATERLPPAANGLATFGFKGVCCLEARNIKDFGAVLQIAEEAHRSTAIADIILYDVPESAAHTLPLLLHQIPALRIFGLVTAEVEALRTINRLLRQPQLAERFAGLIANNLAGVYAETIVTDFAHAVATPVTGFIPRSLVVVRSAFFGETVIDSAPLSHHSYTYRHIARRLQETETVAQPLPLSDEDFDDWACEWGDRLYDYGEGLVSDGAAI